MSSTWRNLLIFASCVAATSATGSVVVVAAPAEPLQQQRTLQTAASACDTLKGCYLRNLQTGVETELANTLLATRSLYTIEVNNTAGFSIRCDLNNVVGSTTNIVNFLYNGILYKNYAEPRWIGGHSMESFGLYVIPIPYLAAAPCGETKTLQVYGGPWANERCFEATYIFSSQCGVGVPTPPIAPVAPTSAAPVFVPIAAPSAPTFNNTPVNRTRAPVLPPSRPPNAWKPPPDRTCPVGQKLISMYCVSISCNDDFTCPINTRRMAAQECYRDIGQCECVAGFVKRTRRFRVRGESSQQAQCVRRMIFGRCPFGRHWWGGCKPPPNAGMLSTED